VRPSIAATLDPSRNAYADSRASTSFVRPLNTDVPISTAPPLEPETPEPSSSSV
jgi:hypothetical protein